MTKRIASVYFAEVSANRDLYGGQYKMPAVPKGEKPFILTVEDKVQSWQMSETYKRQIRRDLISAEEIARDIVSHWTTGGLGMTADCHPGIWIVRDTIPLLNPDGTQQTDGMGTAQSRPATEEEKSAMWDEDLKHAVMADANWAQYLIEAADAMNEIPGNRKFIPQTAKLAARQYGKEREWLSELKDDPGKVCQFCRKTIPTAAIKCQHCSEVVDFAGWAKLDKERQAALKGTPIAPPVKVA